MSENFSTVFLKHTGKLADKWSSYLPIYDRVLAPLRELPVSILEIGVQNGGSLEIWDKYFTDAKIIIGCDIDENCRKLKFESPKIKVVVGGINSNPIFNEIREINSEFDIIIDDGSHKSDDVIESFLKLFPLLKDDGIYIVEDLHTSYWNGYGGGLRGKFSSIEFFKALVDVLNFEHWEGKTSASEHLRDVTPPQLAALSSAVLAHIYQITFVNSICVIEKKSTENNYLGSRKVLGTEEPVTVSARTRSGLEVTLNDRLPQPGVVYKIRSTISHLLGRS